MCGIVGCASLRPHADGAMLSARTATLRHRGPDDDGVWWSADLRVGLGHRRLAIIDLSPAGHQPMVNASGDLAVVLNGEIYNYLDLKQQLEKRGHCFRSASDTEVLLSAYREWGLECLQRLNGMFAFAIYDCTRRRLFMARDRAGEKPLYYQLDPSGLRFASELKALLLDPAVSRRIDPAALDCYLAMGYVPGGRSIVRGVSKLPPAHAMSFEIDSGRAVTWRYWQLPTHDPAPAIHEPALIEELDRLLEDSVRRQLVADVPVGVLLSGGTDSSLITAMAARSTARVMTFTVRFPGFGRYDETEHARLIARHFGTDHVELDAQQASVDLLIRLARQYDEPIVDSSMIPTFLVTQLIRQHCTVALGGDGGDELFGGYGHYRRMLWVERYSQPVPLPVRRAVASVASTLLPVGFRGRNWFQALGYDFRHEVPAVEGVFDASARRALMSGHDWATVAEDIRSERTPQLPDLLQRATRMDFENYLAEDILVKVDRASMLNSLEVRAPFLDYRIIEFAFGKVPSSLKATPGSLKVLLKKLCARVLPAEFDQHRKWGFSIPLVQWLRAGPWAEFFHEVLLAGTEPFFSQSAARSLLDGQRKGRNNSERLFALTLFELWRREYRMTL
jgi:asparagine synthase (glutamine-hydrolysing)